MTLSKQLGTNWNHLKAFNNGGLIEGLLIPSSPYTPIDSSFSVACRLGNITEKSTALNPPPFGGVSGGQDIKGCDITCGNGAITIQEQ
jgi:hypothetical protein